MNKDKAIEAQPIDEKAMTIQAPQSLDKPKQDTEFAQEAATFLVDIIRKNNWSRKLGGQSEHIQYEGWQTAGKYYGYSVKTFDSEYVEFGNTWGFKAKATVVNELTGVVVGGAEAYCMSDEGNWKNKPKFQLASMAQTRAGSKALRQILGFVVALAGYNPTPAEEMIDEPMTPRQMANKLNEPCSECHAPAGKPHASKCASYVDDSGLTHEPTDILRCDKCGEPTEERSGVSSTGRKWTGLFCSSKDRSHTKWLYD